MLIDQIASLQGQWKLNGNPYQWLHTLAAKWMVWFTRQHFLPPPPHTHTHTPHTHTQTHAHTPLWSMCSWLLTTFFPLLSKICDSISPHKWIVKAFRCPVYAVGVLVCESTSKWSGLGELLSRIPRRSKMNRFVYDDKFSIICNSLYQPPAFLIHVNNGRFPTPRCHQCTMYVVKHFLLLV